MNPPFTAPTNHEGKDKHKETINPAFAAFQTTPEEQKAMSDKTKKLAQKTIGDGNAGLGTHFTQIAHNMVKPGGNIAVILPISSMLGGGWHKGRNWSWQKLRQLLSDGYNEIRVISIAQRDTADASFSADTDIAEVMIIARRLRHGEPPERKAHFVNLESRPQNKLEAQETSRGIRKAVAELTELNTGSEICIGDVIVGTVYLEACSPKEKWTTTRVADISLVNMAKSLAKGKLLLPQSAEPIVIPITTMGKIGRPGPLDRDIVERGPFTKKKGANSGTAWPMLWNHDEQGEKKKRTQHQMETLPDTSGTVRKGKKVQANELWKKASHLHINRDFQFNANPTSAAYTVKQTLGGIAWPNLQMDSELMEKATCVWLNSTLGLILYWMDSNRTQNGRGRTTITAIPNIPTLDITKLDKKQLDAAAKIYEDLHKKKMLPANEAHRDPVRQDLDRRIFVEVLGLNEKDVEQLETLRNQWCLEPTVLGTKNTGPED